VLHTCTEDHVTSETSVPSLLGTILTGHNVAKAFKVHTGLLYLKHCCDLFASLLMEACACARTHFTVLSVEICALRMQKGHYCLSIVFIIAIGQHMQWSLALPTSQPSCCPSMLFRTYRQLARKHAIIWCWLVQRKHTTEVSLLEIEA